MKSARTPFAVTLGVCTAVSLAGNVAAATLLLHDLALPTPAVIAAASVAPLLLPAAVHLVPRAAGLPKGARGAVIAAVVVASVAAFALSFASLMAVAQAGGHPGLLGALLPLAVDVLAAAAAYALVVMPALTPTAAPISSPHDAPLTAASATRLEDVDQPVRDLVYPATPAWLTASVARHDTAPEPDHGAAPQPVTSDDAAGQRDAPADDAVTEPRTRSVDAAITPADDANQAAPGTRHSSNMSRSTDTMTRTAGAQPTRRLASVPAAATSDADDALIRRLIAEGASGTDAAAELGVSKSTALRRMKAVQARLAEASA